MGLPTFAALHITDECTHHCPYCYAGNGLCTKEPPRFEKLCEIVLALNRYGFKTIALLGGDPARYLKLYDLLLFIKENTDIRVELLSNTLEIVGATPKDVAPLVGCVETTIHGTEAFHDNLCGCKGAFKNITDKLEIYYKLGVPIDVDINIIPSSINEIYPALEYLYEKMNIVIDNVLLQRIVPFGRAEGSVLFQITRNELNAALMQIEMAQQKYGFNVIAEDTFPFCAMKPQFRRFFKKCEWGTTKIAVNSDGKLSRCGADPRYSLGSILDDDLNEIWENSQEILSFRNKDFLPDKCKSCVYVSECGGGCPLSNTSSDSMFKADYLIQ